MDGKKVSLKIAERKRKEKGYVWAEKQPNGTSPYSIYHKPTQEKSNAKNDAV